MKRSRRRARLLALLAALASLAAFVPAAASASVSWVVHGRGFGHGVGMSAYGAYGYALHGKGYRFILGHYYKGTTVGSFGKPSTIRVLLGTTSGDVGFSGATSACRVKLDPARNYEAHRIGNSVRLRSSGGKLLAKCGAKLRAAGNGRITIAGYGSYRGALEAVPSGGSLDVVNALALEQYAKGVMPNEVPPSWPTEELKAQAVAVRSIALTSDVGGKRLRRLQRHPQPGLQRAGKRVHDDQRGGRSDPRPGRPLQGPGRPGPLLGLLGRPHRERRQRLRLRRPVPGRGQRPLRRRLPAAHLDAQVQRPGNQLQAERPPRRGAQAGRDHQDRRLAADHQRQADRHRRHDDRQRHRPRVGARRLRHLDEVPGGSGERQEGAPVAAGIARWWMSGGISSIRVLRRYRAAGRREIWSIVMRRADGRA